jgi:hypothetical protein
MQFSHTLGREGSSFEFTLLLGSDTTKVNICVLGLGLSVLLLHKWVPLHTETHRSKCGACEWLVEVGCFEVITRVPHWLIFGCADRAA